MHTSRYRAVLKRPAVGIAVLVVMVIIASLLVTGGTSLPSRPASPVAVATVGGSELAEAEPHATLSALPVEFIENDGQWTSDVQFAAWRGSETATFSANEIRMSNGDGRSVGLHFKSAQRSLPRGEGASASRYNFVFGSRPELWHNAARGFAAVTYPAVWRGVDVRVHGNGADELLEYDVLVEPGADLGQAVFRVEGSERISVAPDGALVIEAGGRVLRQPAPVAWEEAATGRRSVPSRFKLLGPDSYGFAVDGRDQGLPLVVDPGLDWATFFGGAGDESVTGLEMTNDGTGDIVLAGQTQSPDFPRTIGNLSPVGWSPYVARLSGDGRRLIYATFFGGSANHSVQDVALDSANRPIVVGDTTSLDFPTTPGAYDRTPGNGFQGDYDAYAIKFDAAGGGPLFGTYLGGAPNSGWEQAWNVVFDSTDRPIVSGFVTSPSFPTTVGAYDRTIGGKDLFISRFSPDGTQLTYSTFFGGNGDEDVFDMVIDPQGVLTLTGKISQYLDQPPFMPTTPGAFDESYNGGGSPGSDAYLLRFKPDGAGSADLRYSTFIGGAQYKEGGTGLAIDPNDPTSVTVVGWTYSADFPTTPGALLRTHFIPVDTSMATVTRFSFPTAGGGTLVWSTLYGAPGNQAANDVTIGQNGVAIVAGASAAANPPTTDRADDRIPGTTAHSGAADGFIARISSDGARNEYSTLLGGSFADDTAQKIVYAGGNSIIAAGLTDSPDFPVTPGAYDTVYAADGLYSGGSAPGTIADDVFVAKLTLVERTGDTTPPAAPVLRGPANGSTYTAFTPPITFDWTDVADASGIAAYHLQVSPNPNFDNALNNVFTGWYEPWLPTSIAVKSFGISETGDFFWRVQALDGANNIGPYSAVGTFLVNSPTPPDAPVLNSPPNGGVFAPGDIVLDWNPAARAKFYEIQVDTNSSFSNPNRLWVRALTATRYTASLPTTGRRWWRVIASNDSFTNSPWSAVRSFDLQNGSPPAPVPPPDQDSGPPPGPNGEATAVVGFSPQEVSVTGGTTGQLDVVLNGVAPPGGAVVALSSSLPQLATVPPSVTVPAGATSATFTITALHNQLARVALISAAYGVGQDQGQNVIVWNGVNSPELYGMSINGSQGPTTTFLGGQTVQGTVSFLPGWNAPPGGAVVTLGSTNPALASVPDSVVIPAGTNSVSFNVTTQPVSQITPVTILAARSMTNRITLELMPPGTLSTLSLNPSTVTGGSPSTGTVTLVSPAPSGGVSVALSSHDTRWATVPATVTVPAGATSANFTVSTSQNTSGEGQWSIIYASAGGVLRQQTINVNPAGTPRVGALASLTLTPSTVVGGNSSTGRATLQLAAPSGGVVVNLFINGVAPPASAPASVTVPAGATSATFTVNTTAITGVNQIVNIVAGSSNSSAEAALTITAPAAPPPPAALSAVSLTPSTVAGGSGSTGTIILTSPAPSGGFAVSLTNSNPAVATVPTTATVPAGASSATFAVSTSTVTATQTASITATAGSVTRSATLTVNPAAPPPPTSVSSLSLNPSTVVGGNASTGTVTLNGAAPAGGTVVTLSSDNTAAATTPANVTVAGGSTTATFTVSTISATTNRSAVISAVAGGVTRTATLTVNAPPPPRTISISDRTLTEGNTGTKSASFTVSLSGSSTSTVTVSYSTTDGTAQAGSDYVAKAPTTLTFTPGQTSKTVSISVNGDTAIEPAETFFVNLSSPTNATIADSQGRGTITDDDQQPTISITDRSVSEGNSGTKNATFTVSLSLSTFGGTVTVSYATADGTATAPSDYTAKALTTLTFSPGQTSKSITVSTRGDTAVEPAETYFVNLSSPTNATIADGQGKGTITNDD